MSGFSIGLWGFGRLGQNLAYFGSAVGWPWRGLVTEHPEWVVALDLASKLPVLKTREELLGFDIVFLALPDRILPGVLEWVRAQPRASLTLWIHCAGTEGMTVFGDAFGLAAHPLVSLVRLVGHPRMFNNPFAGVYWGVTGSDPALALAHPWIESLGSTIVRVSESERIRYHAGATMAANNLVALYQAAAELMPANAPDADRWLLPLMRSVLTNIGNLGPDPSLTGPVIRGDKTTVRRHLLALGDSDQGRLYMVFLRLILDRNGLWDEEWREIIESQSQRVYESTSLRV